jgi:hypothetical protein
LASTDSLTATSPAASTSEQLVGTNLVYPSNLDTSNYYMMLQFVQYERPDIFSSGFNRAVGGISLPLPAQLNDTQVLQFTADETNPVVGAAIENAIHSAKTSSNYATATLSGLINTALGGAAGIAVKGAQNITAAAGTSVNYALSLGGMSVNPFLTVLFKSPTFKHHTFSWRFTPSNSSDSKRIAAITNAFKYHSLPDISGATAGTLLSYPDMLYISIYPVNDFMYKFKPCVIEGVSVNYSPVGPSFIKENKAPSCVDLTISLLEIEYHLKKDWDVNFDGTVSQNNRN